MTILIANTGVIVLILIKRIIAKIDAFAVLPHEGGGKDDGRTLFYMEDIPHVEHTHDELMRMKSYLIAKEVTLLLEDVSDSSKVDSYEEWARFLKLLGNLHRRTDVVEAVDESRSQHEKLTSECGWLRDDGPLFGKKSEPV